MAASRLFLLVLLLLKHENTGLQAEVEDPKVKNSSEIIKSFQTSTISQIESIRDLTFAFKLTDKFSLLLLFTTDDEALACESCIYISAEFDQVAALAFAQRKVDKGMLFFKVFNENGYEVFKHFQVEVVPSILLVPRGRSREFISLMNDTNQDVNKETLLKKLELHTNLKIEEGFAINYNLLSVVLLAVAMYQLYKEEEFREMVFHKTVLTWAMLIVTMFFVSGGIKSLISDLAYVLDPQFYATSEFPSSLGSLFLTFGCFGFNCMCLYFLYILNQGLQEVNVEEEISVSNHVVTIGLLYFGLTFISRSLALAYSDYPYKFVF